MVGATGLEPATPCSQSRCATTAPRPDACRSPQAHRLWHLRVGTARIQACDSGRNQARKVARNLHQPAPGSGRAGSRSPLTVVVGIQAVLPDAQRPSGTWLVGSKGWWAMTERAIPPTARERAAFDAATLGTPKDFVATCRAAGIEPRTMLDGLAAAPYRWLFFFSPGDPVTDEVRHRQFQPAIQERLDAVREYVETPAWRRVFGQRQSVDLATRAPFTRTRLPGR